MSDNVPPIDLDLSERSGSVGQESLEFKLLSTETENQLLKEREFGQRYKIRWIAVLAGLIVICAMFAMLFHLFHSVFLGPFLMVNTGFAIAMIVAPVASITTITIALFVGAFRKFDDRDAEYFGNGAAGAASVFRGS